MSDTNANPLGVSADLDRITTQWSAVNDPERFLLRYAGAIRAYLQSLLKNAANADDVAQEFFLRVVQHGFARAAQDRGRFRDYLKIAVRNAGLTHLRRLQRQPDVLGDALLDSVSVEPAESAEDQEWLADWRRCLLDRVWRALEQHEHLASGNQFCTVLRLSVDHPSEDSPALARRASERSGRPLTAEAFRKQLSRARRAFAELLVQEVAQTLDDPTPLATEEELVAVGLMQHVQPFLPSDWRTRGQLADRE